MPLLVAPSLADSSAEAIDDRTLSHLLSLNLLKKKEEKKEEERQRQELVLLASRRVLSDSALAGPSPQVATVVAATPQILVTMASSGSSFPSSRPPALPTLSSHVRVGSQFAVVPCV